MRKKLRTVAAILAVAAAATFAASMQASAYEYKATVTPNITGANVVDNSLTGADVKTGSLNASDIDQATKDWFTGVFDNTVTTWSVKNGTLKLEDFSPATATALKGATGPTGPKGDTGSQGPVGPQGPAASTGLANWGEIFRNTIKAGHAELGKSSAGEGLTITTPTSADAVSFGNEADFVGKPVVLDTVKYDVFTTGENIALGQNMPSIKIEIKDPTSSATYTTLNYNPENSASNDWTLIDAGADAGNHWGFTGTWFNADPSRCGQNGTRCTLTEALAILGPNAKYISVGVGKGRDYEFHGAVRSLTIDADTFTFGANGVTK